jgi:hypothetical protein
MEEKFPFFPNFFHFGMKPMGAKKIKEVVSDINGVGRLEYLRKGQREGGGEDLDRAKIAFAWTCCYNARDFLARFFVSMSEKPCLSGRRLS